MISTCCNGGSHMIAHLCVVASISNSQQEGTDHHHIDAAGEVVLTPHSETVYNIFPMA